MVTADFGGYLPDGRAAYRATGDGPQCNVCGVVRGHADECEGSE